MLRRLRAVLVIALLWAVPWFGLGAVLGARFVLIARAPLLIIPMLGFGTAIEGAAVGFAFGVILLLVGRLRSADWMTIGIGAVLAGAVGFGLGARAEPGYGAAVVFALFAAACAVASLRVARRAPQADAVSTRIVELE